MANNDYTGYKARIHDLAAMLRTTLPVTTDKDVSVTYMLQPNMVIKVAVALDGVWHTFAKRIMPEHLDGDREILVATVHAYFAGMIQQAKKAHAEFNRGVASEHDTSEHAKIRSVRLAPVVDIDFQTGMVSVVGDPIENDLPTGGIITNADMQRVLDDVAEAGAKYGERIGEREGKKAEGARIVGLLREALTMIGMKV